MRTHGTLTKWVEERGFGFITPADGGKEVFVHISAFPKGGGRPQLGELLSFEVIDGPDGKRKAAALMRPGSTPTRARAGAGETRPRAGTASSGPGAAVVLVLAILGGVYLFNRQPEPMQPVRMDAQPLLAEPRATETEAFTCDGRAHCTQMTSCEEAVYFIEHCPNTKMDGDNDGHPCEDHLCKRN